MRGRRSPAF
jgi:hypothetical protein